MMTNKIKLVFFATPDIALNSFKFFANSSDYSLLALVTQPQKPSGRGKKITKSNIKLEAENLNIPVFEPEKISKDVDTIQKLKELAPDFFVTFAFGQILSQEVIDIPKFATINLHASLLPKFRGANPICEAILCGETKTGITTMKTTLELDAGDICLQEEILITKNMTTPELMAQIASLSPNLLDKTLKGLYSGELNTVKQDSELATFTKKIKKEDKEIFWDKCADEIHNKIRSMCEINTCHVKYDDKLLKILKSEVSDKKSTGNFGEVISIDKNGICVSCLNGSVNILTVKPEGKKEMSAYSWSLGSKIKVGDIFKQC